LIRHSLLIASFACCAAAKDYTTYIGDEFAYHVTALAADANGNTYITGSRTIPIAGSTAALSDVFVTKLDGAGNLLFTRTFSGKGTDQANAIALDAAGNIFIAGNTNSADFPLRSALQTVPGISSIGFLMKLAPDGSMLFSTLLGGTQGTSSLNAVAVDSKGDVYVAGRTSASDYPHTAGLPDITLPPQSRIHAAFFAKISSAGDKILYAGAVAATTHACGAGSSCFLSEITTSGDAIAVDPAGNAYIAGNTNGAGLQGTTGALFLAGIGAFVMKVNAAGTEIAYLTFLGTTQFPVVPFANPANTITAIAADASGNVVIAGATSDPFFLSPTPPRVNTCALLQGSATLFVAKLNATGSGYAWARVGCGTLSQNAQTLAVDSKSAVTVAGTDQIPPNSAVFFMPSSNDILLQTDSTGTTATLTTWPTNFLAAAIAFDSSGTLHTAGPTGLVSTFSPGQFAATRMYGLANSAGSKLTGRLAPGELFSVYGTKLGAAAKSGSFDSVGFLPNTLGGVQITVNGVAAPLLYVSDKQINAVVPLEAASGEAHVRITVNGTQLQDFRAFVDSAAPQVFRYPDGSVIAVNQDGSFNSHENPALPGSLVAIWVSGAGAVAGVDGQRIGAAKPGPLVSVDAATGPVNVAYAGASPGTVTGLTQVNFRVSELLRGLILSVSANGKSSEPFFIYSN
jgi:uncharacterized protein (TIGR03437 family)